MTTEEIITCDMCKGSGNKVVNTGEIDTESRDKEEKKVVSCGACKGTGRLLKVVSTTIKPFDRDAYTELQLYFARK